MHNFLYGKLNQYAFFPVPFIYKQEMIPYFLAKMG